MHVLYSVAKQPTKIDKRSHSEGFTDACKHLLCNDACSNQRAGKCRYRMPAPIREQGNAGIGCLLQLESREMPVLGNEGYTTVGNPTLGVTSILTKLRWDGGVIRVIVIRAMLLIRAMPLIQVCYYRPQAMILQATTDHYSTSPPVRTYPNVIKGR